MFSGVETRAALGSGSGGSGSTMTAAGAFKNLLIGGDASTNPWQRGTSVSLAGAGSTAATSGNTTLYGSWSVSGGNITTHSGASSGYVTSAFTNNFQFQFAVPSSIPGTMEFGIASSTPNVSAGDLISHNTSIGSYFFAIPAIGSSQTITFYYNGTSLGTVSRTVAAGDVFAIVRIGTALTVTQNGATIYTFSGFSSSAAQYGVLAEAAGDPTFNSVAWQINMVAPSAYTADRFIGWGANVASSATVSKVSSGLTGFPSAFRLQRSAGNADTGVLGVAQIIETINVQPFQGKTLTLSFQARAGANFSAASNALTVNLATGTGTDEGSAAFIAGTWTGQSNNTSAKTLTTSFQTFTATITVPSGATELAVSFSYTPTGTAGSNDYVDLAAIELDSGGATTFEALPADVVKMRCRRYAIVASFYVPGSVAQIASFDMRATPTITGGAAGFTSTGTTADSLIGYQTSGGATTLTLSAEL
jgi:hypothetical protein